MPISLSSTSCSRSPARSRSVSRAPVGVSLRGAREVLLEKEVADLKAQQKEDWEWFVARSLSLESKIQDAEKSAHEYQCAAHRLANWCDEFETQALNAKQLLTEKDKLLEAANDRLAELSAANERLAEKVAEKDKLLEAAAAPKPSGTPHPQTKPKATKKPPRTPGPQAKAKAMKTRLPKAMKAKE